MPHQPLYLLILSVVVLAGLLAKVLAVRVRLPAVVGYLLLGVGLRAVDTQWHLFDDTSTWALGQFAQLGIILLLFHVGLESNLKGLIGQLPSAVGLWLANVVVSAVAGVATVYALGMGLVPALFVAAAFSATSIGLTVAVWEDAGLMKTRLGNLLLDLAELDDLSAIFLMLLVVSVAPFLRTTVNAWALTELVAVQTGWMLVKIAVFTLACWGFARYCERHVTAFLGRADGAEDGATDRLITVLGLGLLTAAVAEWIGFSVAVGALFAGLMFSRDPDAVKYDLGLLPLRGLLAPFFFIEIGFGLEPTVLMSSLGLGIILTIPAILAKVLGTALPMWRRFGGRLSVIMGVSMVPRAEIALIVVRAGRDLGDWAVPPELYGAMVVMCAITAFAAPLFLGPQLARAKEQIT